MPLLRDSRVARPATLGVLVAVLAACGGNAASPAASEGAVTSASPAGSASVAPSGLGSGWTVASAEGFTIGVPEGWLQLSADDLQDSGALDVAASANPEMAATLEQVQTAIESGQIAFFAIETEPADDSVPFSANVNVLDAGATSGSPEDAAEEMAAGIEAQLPVSGSVETGTASLPAGEAGRITYEWSVTGADGSAVDVSVTQYAIIADGNAHILSFSAATATMEEYGPIFERMAESFALD